MENPRIRVHQIYYNDETRGKIDPAFIPYYNPTRDNYFENSVMLDIHSRSEGCDFIGVTSPRCKEKTGMDGSRIIKLVENNIDKDVIVYTPAFYPTKTDIWKNYAQPNSGKTSIYRVAEILNRMKCLPFDLFEKGWTYCLCNYWIARKNIFDDYVSRILRPTIEMMATQKFKKEICSFSTYNHRGIYPIETFVLEGLFGSYLANNNHKIYNHFNK